MNEVVQLSPTSLPKLTKQRLDLAYSVFDFAMLRHW